MDSKNTLRVNLLLAGLGAVAGALISIPITAIGKSVSVAESATLANYLWNAGVFAGMAAFAGPLLTWAALPRVPLWRAFGEPAVGAVAVAAAALVLGTPLLFLFMPVGIGAAVWRLNYVYREPKHIALPNSGNATDVVARDR